MSQPAGHLRFNHSSVLSHPYFARLSDLYPTIPLPPERVGEEEGEGGGERESKETTTEFCLFVSTSILLSLLNISQFQYAFRLFILLSLTYE
jgi:hypothetical protein